MVTQQFLESQGFVKDNRCAPVNNRWEKQVGKFGSRDYWVSITLTEDGERTKYGVLNFYSMDNSGPQPYEFISKHRYFNGALSKEDYSRFIDRHSEWKNI